MASPTATTTQPVSSAAALPRSVTSGLGWGLTIWWAYAIVEYILLSVIPLFRDREAVFGPEHWRSSGLLFDTYWILGALSGAAAGTLAANCDLSARNLDRSRLPATLGLLVAVQVNLCCTIPLGSFAWLTLFLAFAFSVAILWALRHPNSAIVNLVEFNPFLLAFLLISPTWLSTEALEDFGIAVKVAAVLLAIGASVGGNWLLRRSQWPAGRHFLSGVAVMTLIVSVCGFRSFGPKVVAPLSAPALPDPGRPPVILVVFDTTRADHMSLYGYSRNTTPHLAEFAAGATLYTKVMAAADLTLSSHGSMFTGVYPSWHGARKQQPLDDRLPTLAGLLSAQGYSTMATAANSAYLVPRWGMNRGFQRFSVHNQIEAVSSSRRFQLRQGIRSLLAWIMPTSEFERLWRSGREINEEGLHMISQPAVRGRSFFLFMNYMDAHVPYLPPAPFNTLFLGGTPVMSYARFQARFEQWYKHRTPVPEDDARLLAAQYDGGIAYEDFAFHEFISKLKGMGLYDRSMIIVTADHGEAFGDHGVWGHGRSTHSDQVNVPLIIKYPGQNTASIVSAPVSQVDLLPTVLDTLGYPTPDHVQGRGLRRPDLPADRQLFAESSEGRALRWGALKLIVSSTGKHELYEIERDPHETHDLYSLANPDANSMDAAFAQWMRLIPNARPRGTSPADQEELRRLRGLGYVQ